jgi:LPS-assembly lipoprotein
MRRGEIALVRYARLGIALALAAAAGGCFQPLYGQRTATGAPALRQALSAVDVASIAAPSGSLEARLTTQLRNDLIFNFTGGGARLPPTHLLKVQFAGNHGVILSSSVTGLPVVENYVLNATYTLVETKTGQTVVTGRATTTVSFDPSGTQRFARINGLQDAERRAAKVIAEDITTRMAAYFISGT